MKEFIEKLIEKLNDRMEYLDSRHKILTDAGLFKESDKIADKMVEVDFIKQIVNQLAEEYNNGWIPCSERLPEEKENPITHDYMQYPVMVKIGTMADVRYYYYGNGHWRLGFQIMDEYVTHWMDIAPYQPKGE